MTLKIYLSMLQIQMLDLLQDSLFIKVLRIANLLLRMFFLTQENVTLCA